MPMHERIWAVVVGFFATDSWWSVESEGNILFLAHKLARSLLGLF